jgi:hypothetical protein
MSVTETPPVENPRPKMDEADHIIWVLDHLKVPPTVGLNTCWGYLTDHGIQAPEASVRKAMSLRKARYWMAAYEVREGNGDE